MRPIVGDFAPDRACPAGQEASPLGLSSSTLAPILAGAYARGMADILDGVGLPALFLRRDGRVLFATEPARACLGGGLRLEAEHVVADGADDNRRLSRFLAAAIVSRNPAQEAFDLPDGGTLRLHLLPLPTEAGNGGQIVDAVVLLDAGTDPVLTAIITRMTAMQGLGRLTPRRCEQRR